MFDFKKICVTFSILKLQKCDIYQNGVEFRHKPNDDDVKWPPPLFCLPPPLCTVPQLMIESRAFVTYVKVLIYYLLRKAKKCCLQYTTIKHNRIHIRQNIVSKLETRSKNHNRVVKGGQDTSFHILVIGFMSD